VHVAARDTTASDDYNVRAARSQRVARVGIIAAIYAALTLATMLLLGGLSWGPLQFRISEAVCVLALFTADAIPGLALGCAIANIANIALAGLGTLGLLDVVFGTFATVLGALFTWRFRSRPVLAVAGPVLSNALIVSAYLPILLKGLGFYTIPLTSINLDNSYALMYLFGFITTGLGEAAVMYALGLPLARALAQTPLFKTMGQEERDA